jgi:hypothetical protein
LKISDVFKKPRKKNKVQERMKKIRESGKDGELYFEQDNALANIERVHHGADYERTVHDSAGRERKVPYEVKRNNSPLSKLQKKTRGLRVVKYINTPYGKVKKMYDRFGNEKEENPLNGKFERVRKRGTALIKSLLESNSGSKPRKSRNLNLDDLFGSSPPKNHRKANGSELENFGFSSNSSKKRKSKNSVHDSFWGSTSYKKRKSKNSVHDSFWGSDSSSKSKRSSGSNYGSLLGSGSSSKRKSGNGFW